MANKLTLSRSPNGEIDATKYSLYEVLHDKRLLGLKINEKTSIFNSWLRDLDHNSHASHKRVLLTGSKARCDTETKKQMINFGTNDYLNLSQHPRVRQAAIDCLTNIGAGSGSAPLFSGTMQVQIDLEQKIAESKKMEAAMVFSSGFAANYGTISALLGPNDLAIFDMFAHASLNEGGVQTNVTHFKHNDAASLEHILKKNKGQYKNTIVILDSVYSMDGDIAKLDEITEVAHRFGAYVLADEAHATGVIGKTGKGVLEHFDLYGKVDIITGTMSKAIGSVGGFVASTDEIIKYLQFKAKTYFFSTAGFTPAIASALEALKVIEEEPEHLKNLWNNINYFKERLIENGFNIGRAETAVFPIIIGNDYKVFEITRLLHEDGIFVNPVPYPAVPRRFARIRLTVTSQLTFDDLDYTIKKLIKYKNQLNF